SVGWPQCGELCGKSASDGTSWRSRHSSRRAARQLHLHCARCPPSSPDHMQCRESRHRQRVPVRPGRCRPRARFANRCVRGRDCYPAAIPIPHLTNMTRPLSCLLLLAFSGLSFAQPAQPLTMERIMAHPDWIGQPVESAWWSWDGNTAYYTLKRDGSTIRDIHALALSGDGASRTLDGAGRAGIDAAQPLFDPQRTRMAFVRNG